MGKGSAKNSRGLNKRGTKLKMSKKRIRYYSTVSVVIGDKKGSAYHFQNAERNTCSCTYAVMINIGGLKLHSTNALQTSERINIQSEK